MQLTWLLNSCSTVRDVSRVNNFQTKEETEEPDENSSYSVTAYRQQLQIGLKSGGLPIWCKNYF